ncbi:MAG: hypothetical protein O2779_02640 [Nanoarchaeota archaeon]|nr:hypothetical protein [Nanoarchaeota archaeon]
MDSKKVIIVILVIALFISIFGNNDSPDIPEDIPEEVVEDTCTARALCTDVNSRAYRNADCSLIDEEVCDTGCEAGVCLAAPVETVVINQVEDVIVETVVETVSDLSVDCDIGLACLDTIRRGHRNSNCVFSNVQSCPFGCKAGSCLSATDADFVVPDKKVATSGSGSFDFLAWRFSDFSEGTFLVEENYNYDVKLRYWPISNRYNYFTASGFSGDIWIMDIPFDQVTFKDCSEGVNGAVSYSKLRTDQTLCVETKEKRIAAVGGTWDGFPGEQVVLNWKFFE